ncbi:hypothetical protein DSO57_1024340 [Entomophthora muscae]|uniref:Uncharacterized protein n=1 Tax=Entomophthora muscae TaxID=34485 RepID=A0ACC2TDQ7_9FUNG|nr:hypothetical protein DSO57_1024340 [Entomophthora muscae]
MRELEKLLKDLDLAIAKIKDIDRKVKAKVKYAVLTGDKIDKVSAKALISKMPDTPEKTIKRLLNIQKTVVDVTLSSIMPGIVRPSKKAQKAGKPVSKLTKLTDLNQTVDQKWVTAAPVCQLKPAPPCKMTLIN